MQKAGNKRGTITMGGIVTSEKLQKLCEEKFGAYIDFPFGDLPICYKVKGKIFAEIYPAEDLKITVSLNADDNDFFRNSYPDAVARGYHCPASLQPYWSTVSVNKLSEHILFEIIDLSYKRAVSKLPVKVQKSI